MHASVVCVQSAPALRGHAQPAVKVAGEVRLVVEAAVASDA